MKVDRGTISAKRRLSRRAVWIPLMTGVALWIVFPVRTLLFAAWPQHLRSVPDYRSSAGQFKVAQAQEGGEAPEVPPDQVEKYINAYKAMQRNHSLTVDEAAGQQGLSVKQFRDIEGKIERDDMLREHVRQVLSKSSNPGTQ